MDDEELLKFLKKRQGLLDGVAFTGGEPLLRRDLAPLLEKIHALGFAVKMDTNGNHPDQLKALVHLQFVESNKHHGTTLTACRRSLYK